MTFGLLAQCLNQLRHRVPPYTYELLKIYLSTWRLCSIKQGETMTTKQEMKTHWKETTCRLFKITASWNKMCPNHLYNWNKILSVWYTKLESNSYTFCNFSKQAHQLTMLVVCIHGVTRSNYDQINDCLNKLFTNFNILLTVHLNIFIS